MVQAVTGGGVERCMLMADRFCSWCFQRMRFH